MRSWGPAAYETAGCAAECSWKGLGCPQCDVLGVSIDPSPEEKEVEARDDDHGSPPFRSQEKFAGALTG